MTTVRVETLLPASPERAYDLAGDLEAHTRSAAHTGELVVRSTVEGALRTGDEIVFSARHLGVRWTLAARIVAVDRPHRFEDIQIRGPSRAMRHEHLFAPVEGGTLMTDVMTVSAPFGWLTEPIIARHLARFLRTRNEHLREVLAATCG